ncbi:endonuclease/exonuclease/phosphatase family protein [Thalassomonas sp. M1454]|uniref:endonuclease/exonuclease/phosphatase family protein n=1 Tax=Thalassomonas sp. M1454 TaxID=2594477 RepID=UPI001C8F2340|nr:endonuclease/exonuclease/phosphatase family protein [Thalassomonas sp. M1454]
MSESSLSLTSELPHSVIKVATFNLFNFIEPPLAFYDFDKILSTQQWHKKQKWIKDYLDEFSPDIIGFQEVFSIETLQKLTVEQGFSYFAVVDEPNIVDDFICDSPVVAIASKFPIKQTCNVAPDLDIAKSIGLTSDFKFSRKVLRATIDLPHAGLIDCYVVHFKSKRPMLDLEQQEDVSESSLVSRLKAQIAGGWGSAIIRGSESSLLLIEMINRRQQKGYPMMLLGDFNNPLDDGILAHLTTESLRFYNDNDEVLNKYYLKDSWQLYCASFNTNAVLDETLPNRKPTHYYGAKGSVLDYILLSSEFDAGEQASLFEVSEHHTYDRHLINPIFERDGESTDHGVVMITLSLRS